MRQVALPQVVKSAMPAPGQRLLSMAFGLLWLVLFTRGAWGLVSRLQPGESQWWTGLLGLCLLPGMYVLWRRLRRPGPLGWAAGGSSTVVCRFVSDLTAVFGALTVCTLIAAALLAPYLTRHDPIEFQDIDTGRYQEPGRMHLLGTDQFGRDVSSRLLHGARVSLAVGFIAVTLAIGLGTVIGLIAGYVGSWSDSLAMRGIDLLIAFPRLFLVLMVVSLTKPSLWTVIVVLGLTGWMGTARLVRAEVLRLRELEYVQAARALGYPITRVLWRHVLPNALAPVIVSATLMVGNVILAESVLSFLGLGVQVPTPSWGSMIDEGRQVFPHVWWLSTFPGLAITLTVVAFNLLGDGLRDAFDPRQKRRVSHE